MPATTAPLKPTHAPPARGMRWGMWGGWVLLCVLVGLGLERVFRQTTSPGICRLGVVVLVAQTPWNPVLVVEREASQERVHPTMLARHAESSWWNLRLTPLAASPDAGGMPGDAPAALIVLRIETDTGGVLLDEYARHSDGWTLTQDATRLGPIATTTGAPLVVNDWSLWRRLVLRTGPDAGRVLVEELPGGRAWVEDLREAREGERALGVRGGLELVMECDIDVTQGPPGPRTVRVENAQGTPGQILKAWSTIGAVDVHPDRSGLVWTVPEEPMLGRVQLASALCAGVLALLPAAHGWSRARRSPAGRSVARIMVASGAYAGVLMLLFAPGLTDPDTMFRAGETAFVAHATPVSPTLLSTWQQPAKSLLMMVPGQWLGSHTLLSFVQAWWVYASVGLLGLVACGPRCGLGIMLACMAMPHVATHAASMLPDAATGAALCTIGAVVLWVRRDGASFSRAAWCVCTVAWMVSCVVLMTFRANALTTIVVVAPAAWWACSRYSTLRAAGGVGWSLACLALRLAFPVMVPWEARSTASASLAWEHVGMLALARDDALTRRHALDDLGRYTDATTKSIALYDWISHDPLLLQAHSPLSRELVTDARSRMPARWWALVRERPATYARMKWELAKSMLGLRHYVPITVLSPHDHPLMAYYGIDLRPRAVLGGSGWYGPRNQDGWSGSAGLTRWLDARWRWFMTLYIPYVWIALALIMAAMAWRGGSLRASVVLLMLLSASYYAGYLVLTPGIHWRYFMPSFLPLLVVVVAVPCHVACDVRARARGR